MFHQKLGCSYTITGVYAMGHPDMLKKLDTLIFYEACNLKSLFMISSCEWGPSWGILAEGD